MCIASSFMILPRKYNRDADHTAKNAQTDMYLCKLHTAKSGFLYLKPKCFDLRFRLPSYFISKYRRSAQNTGTIGYWAPANLYLLLCLLYCMRENSEGSN